MVAVQSEKFPIGTDELRIDNTAAKSDSKVAAVVESTCGTLDNAYCLSSFDACWFGMQLDGVENLKSTIKKNRTMIKLGGRGSLLRTGSTHSSHKSISFLESCRQSHFVDYGFQEDAQPLSSVLFAEKGWVFHQPNESVPHSDAQFWKGEVLDGRIKLSMDTLMEEKRSCQSRRELPMLHKTRKASQPPISLDSNFIKCQHSAKEVCSSVLKALIFRLGVGVGIKYMLDFSKTEVDSLLQKLREATDKIPDFIQQLDSKNKNCMDGMVSCSSMSEDPDSYLLLNDSASRSTDVKTFYNDAAEGSQFTSGRESGALFEGNLRVDSADTWQIVDLERELEAELEILQMNLANECLSHKGLSGVSDLELDPFVEVVHGGLNSFGLPKMHDVIDDKDRSPDISMQAANWAICPRELDRRLQLLLQIRQEKQISELEAELKAAELQLESKGQLLEAWKGRVQHLTMILSSGDDHPRIKDQRRNSIAFQAERNFFPEYKRDTGPKDPNTSTHDHVITHVPLKHLDQTTANFNKHTPSPTGSNAEEGVTPATTSMENATIKNFNEHSWENLLLDLDVISQEEGYVIMQGRCKSEKGVPSEQVAGQGMDVDAFESSRTKTPLQKPFGFKASNSPEPFRHSKNASCTATDAVGEYNSSHMVYEQCVRGGIPIFMNIGGFDKCRNEDDQGCIWNNSCVSSQRKQRLSVSSSSSENDSLSDESSTLDNLEDIGEALIKRIVEKTKSGSSIVRDIQTMLAMFENQEKCHLREENASA